MLLRLCMFVTTTANCMQRYNFPRKCPPPHLLLVCKYAPPPSVWLVHEVISVHVILYTVARCKYIQFNSCLQGRRHQSGWSGFNRTTFFSKRFNSRPIGDYDVRGSIDERSTGRYLDSSPGLGKAWARGYTSISSSAIDAIARSGACELAS